MLSKTTHTARPRFEGSNISTWIGFKHVMYLFEEAILQHFRAHSLPPQHLYEELGLCLELVASAANIRHALHMDDEVRLEVTPLADAQPGELLHKLEAYVDRAGRPQKAASGKISTLLRAEPGRAAAAPQPLRPYIHPEIRRAADLPAGAAGITTSRAAEAGRVEPAIVDRLVAPGENAFVWRWHIPYFYCHFTERLQLSGYLRLMEEVVDLFLASRGISIRTMLTTRHWIPVVPSAQVEILREAYMEEPIYTVYRVERIFKDLTYTARMDCYVPRGEDLVHTASGRIVHGYSKILGPSRWELVPFDAATLAALRGEP